MSVYAWLGKNRNFGAAGQFPVSALIASWVNFQCRFTNSPCTCQPLWALQLRYRPRRPLRAHRLTHCRYRSLAERRWFFGEGAGALFINERVAS